MIVITSGEETGFDGARHLTNNGELEQEIGVFVVAEPIAFWMTATIQLSCQLYDQEMLTEITQFQIVCQLALLYPQAMSIIPS